jgi:hypothetical protein
VQDERDYETAAVDHEILEKGGYSPRPRVFDLDNLPNAPMYPPPGADVAVTTAAAAMAAEAPAGKAGSDSGPADEKHLRDLRSYQELFSLGRS